MPVPARRRADPRLRPRPHRGAGRRGEEPDARAAREGARCTTSARAADASSADATSTGAPLIPGTGMLDADSHRSSRCAAASPPALGDDVLRAAARTTRQASRIPLTVNRTPFYCSGCPHNLSTRVPEGTLVGGGIGCHAMVALMEPDRVGDIAGLTAMGNEGAQWIGMAPFVDRDHLVQNLGDGTYFHSGSLAIRAAVRRRRQHHLQAALQRHRRDDRRAGPAGPDDRAGRRAGRCCSRASSASSSRPTTRASATTPTSGRWPHGHGRRGVGPHPADRGPGVLAAVPGVTVLIHDQAARPRSAATAAAASSPSRTAASSSTSGCARAAATAATRATACRCSRSTRRTAARPASTRRAATSTCRACRATARRSHRSTRRRRAAGQGRRQARTGRAHDRRSRPTACPIRSPAVPTDEFTVRFSGIGGTGVITVSQILGTAAMLDGYDRPRPRPDRALAEGRARSSATCGSQPTATCRRRTTPTAPASTACSRSTCSSRPATPTAPAPSAGRTIVDRLGRIDTDRLDGRPPDHRRTRELDALTGRLDEVSQRRATTATSTLVGASPPGCSATRRRPTSSCSASPCRPAPSPSTPTPSSGRSSSTASPSSATSPPSAGAGAGSSRPTEVEAGRRAARRRADAETLDELIERLADDLVDYQSAAYARPLPPPRRRRPRRRAARRPGEQRVHRGRRPATCTS